MKESAGLGMPSCRAVEVSTCIHDNLHILGYRVPVDNKKFLGCLEDYRARRVNRIKRIIDILASQGLSVSFSDINAGPGHSIGRPHIADMLKRRGYARTRHEAFQKYLVPGRPAYIPSAGPLVEEAVCAIREAGGIPVLAHPGVIMKIADIPRWRDCGLEGLEVFYPAHTMSMTRKLLEIAERYSLIATAGTDYHGPGSGRDDAMGMEIPDENFRQMRERLFE